MNETTPPIMTINDELLAELEQLAIGAKGWNMPIAFQEPEEGFLPEDWEWHVGTVDEDDIRYPLLHVNAHQYDSDDSEKLARYYAAVNRDTILALLQHVRELKADAGRYRWLRDTGPRLVISCPLIAMCDSDGSVMRREHGSEMLLSGDSADAAIDAARSSAD